MLHTSARLVYRTLDLGAALERPRSVGCSRLGRRRLQPCSAVRSAGGARSRRGRGGGGPAARAAARARPGARGRVVRARRAPAGDDAVSRLRRSTATRTRTTRPSGAIGALALIGVAAARRSSRTGPTGASSRSRSPCRATLLLLGLYAKYNIWLTRFLLVPVVLTAPLFARFLSPRLARSAVLVVAGLDGRLHARRTTCSKPLLGDAVGAAVAARSRTTRSRESPAQPTGGKGRGDGARLRPARARRGLRRRGARPGRVVVPALGAAASAPQGPLPPVARRGRDGVPPETCDYVVVSTGVNAPVGKAVRRPPAGRWSRSRPTGNWRSRRASRPGGCRELTVGYTCPSLRM